MNTEGDIRNNSIVGIVEINNISPDDAHQKLHFSEWWNGEGLDVTISSDSSGDEKRISLHLDEMHALVVSFILAGTVDIKDAMKDAKGIAQKSKEKRDDIKRIREKYLQEENGIF
mgnify:CR=1 FL=1